MKPFAYHPGDFQILWDAFQEIEDAAWHIQLLNELIDLGMR